MRRLAGLLIAATVAFSATAFAQQAPAGRTLETSTAPRGEAVKVSVDRSKGFARIGFLWPKAVTFEASVADGVLVVRFARPFQLAQSNLPLDGYVSVIKQDPDGRTLRFQLSQRVRLHTSAAGPLVGIDLLPERFAGEPDDVVDPTAKPPAPKGPVAVKLEIGVYEDKTRLAFEWGEVVPYEVKVADGTIKAVFNRGGAVDVTRLNKNPPGWVRAARASGGDDKLLLEIDVDQGSQIKDFRNKTRVVFDVMAPKNDKDAEPTVELPEGIRPATEAEPAKAEAKPEDPHAPAKEAEPAHGKPDSDHAKAEDPPPGSDGAAVKDKEKEKHEAEAKPESETKPEPKHEPEAKPAEKEHAAAPPAHDAVEATPTVDPVFAAVRSRDTITLTLPVLADKGVAMFRRGNAVFILFEGAGAIDVAQIEKLGAETVADAAVSSADGVTTLRIDLAKSLALSAGLHDGAWRATLAPDAAASPTAIALLRDARSVGPASVRALMDRATRTVSLTDPQSGESLTAILASGDPQGVVAPRAHVEFAADATAQGLLVRPFVDDLTTEIGAHDVIISRPGGLSLSAGAVSASGVAVPTIGEGAAPAAMDFRKWAGAGTFLETRSTLVNALGAGDDVVSPRLALARFYLAHDLGAEALGTLQLLVRDDDKLTRDLGFLALRAVALLQLGRPQQALDDLAATGFDGDANALLLRGLALAGLGRWSTARDALVAGEAAIGDFPPDWQMRFRIAAARASLETNALDVADRMIGALPKSASPTLMMEADLVRGQFADRLGHTDDALRLYDAVQAKNYRPLAVRAAFAEIVLKERTGAMDRDTAIAELDSLRWQWRGDKVELGTLRTLGGLQIAKGDYRNGLQTLRSILLGFPEDPDTRAVGQEMDRVFEELFLRGKADELPPIQALGLYYDFKELTPIGAMGDEMVRKLADRLIAVDLLEQAAELLQHQVDRRLDGVAKAQIAAKLAAVYLMDRKPEKALAALRASSQTRLPDTLAAQRRLLTGRALSDLKQPDAALESFEQDDTIEARRLRADVLWAASRWAETAAAVEVLLDGRDADSRPLDAGERYDVLRAAVAYTMADDEPGLAGLRRRYVAMMADAPEAAAFELVTRAADPSGVALRELAKTIAGVDTLDAFLQSLGLGKPADGTASN